MKVNNKIIPNSCWLIYRIEKYSINGQLPFVFFIDSVQDPPFIVFIILICGFCY